MDIFDKLLISFLWFCVFVVVPLSIVHGHNYNVNCRALGGTPSQTIDGHRHCIKEEIEVK